MEFNCPCKRCILTDVLKLEQRKQYKDACQVLQTAYNYHSKLAQDFKNELVKLQSKLKEAADQQVLEFTSYDNFKTQISTSTYHFVPNVNCAYGSKPDYSTIIKCQNKFSCPVAIFQPENPKQKAMYPKNLVYADGKDIQLEEIRAAFYLRREIKTQAGQAEKTEKPIKEQECSVDEYISHSIGSPPDDINLPKPKINDVTKIISTNAGKCSPTTSLQKRSMEDKETNLTPQEIQSILKTPLADRTVCQNLDQQEKSYSSKPTPDKKLVARVSEAFEHLCLGSNVNSRLNRRRASTAWESCKSENKAEAKFDPLILPAEVDDKENILPSRVSHSWKDDNEEDDAYNTKNFPSILASSTPRHRKNQFFSPAQNINGTYVIETDIEKEHQRRSEAVHTIPNLSVIFERSKERSTFSSSSSVTNIKTGSSQEKTPLSAIKEAEEKSYTAGPKFNEFADPFDKNLIKQFLEDIRFPCERHLSGFFSTSVNIPQMKLSSVVKLDSEKYSIVGEQGKGNYAKIFKANVANTSKPVALKLQKPACLWEYYISKEIRHRLKSEEKVRFFLNYSNIFVFKNGSILLSEWAACGSLLNFVSCLRASPQFRTRCPTNVTVCTSIQLVSIIHYLHSCKIIHGDIKPDNFVVCHPISSSVPYVKLIDYGRSIDMTLFAEGTVFTKVVSTEDFTCNEMKENKPWTYQTDLYGLAGTIYVLLAGEYMKTAKRSDGTWHLKKQIPRYVHRDLWDPIFETLLNHPSHNSLHSLAHVKDSLQRFFDDLDPFAVNQQFNHVSSLFKK